MTRHSIDDYGHTTQTVPITALEAAVQYAEAEVRARIAAEIMEQATQPCESWDRSCACNACSAHEEAMNAAAIALGDA